MKVFSTIKKYNKFIPDGAIFEILDNFPTFNFTGDLLDIHYNLLKQDDIFVTMQITGFFENTTSGGAFALSDNFQVITVPRVDSNTDLGVLGSGIQGIFLQGAQSFRFTHLVPIFSNEFVNKYMVIQSAFQNV